MLALKIQDILGGIYNMVHILPKIYLCVFARQYALKNSGRYVIAYQLLQRQTNRLTDKQKFSKLNLLFEIANNWQHFGCLYYNNKNIRRVHTFAKAWLFEKIMSND